MKTAKELNLNMLILFCASAHWVLFVVDFQFRSVEIYDSVRWQQHTVEISTDLFVMFENVNGDDSGRAWSLRYVFEAGKQSNRFDCGVYLCFNATYVASQQQRWDVSDGDMTQCQTLLVLMDINYDVVASNYKVAQR